MEREMGGGVGQWSGPERRGAERSSQVKVALRAATAWRPEPSARGRKPTPAEVRHACPIGANTQGDGPPREQDLLEKLGQQEENVKGEEPQEPGVGGAGGAGGAGTSDRVSAPGPMLGRGRRARSDTPWPYSGYTQSRFCLDGALWSEADWGGVEWRGARGIGMERSGVEVRWSRRGAWDWGGEGRQGAEKRGPERSGAKWSRAGRNGREWKRWGRAERR